jgi:hypothetical protein
MIGIFDIFGGADEECVNSRLLQAAARYASCLPTAQTQTLLKKTISDKLK